jgi:hypothetical protein
MTIARTWGPLSLTAMLVVAGTAFADDEVERRVDGKTTRVRGKVTDENNRKVIVQTGDGDVTIPPHEIVGVRYDRQPAELITIRGQMDA